MRLVDTKVGGHPVACLAEPRWRLAYSENDTPSWPEIIDQCLWVNVSWADSVLGVLVSKRLSIPKPAAVRVYLLNHPDLIEIVSTICDVAIEKFTDDTQLSLEVYRDPEIEDEYLALYARHLTYTDDLLQAIDEIQRIYTSRLLDKSGWFQITTDFAPPQ